MAKEITIIIDGERYEFRKTKYTDVEDVCSHCALQEICRYSEDITLCETFGVVEENTFNFQEVEADTPAPHPEYVTHEELEARLAQFEPKAASDYANDRLVDKVYHEIDRLDIQEREENKKNYPGCGGRQKAGNAMRFMNVAKEHDIETVGQLLEVGRARFERFKNIGRLCADRISEALDNLYGIKSW